MLPRTVYLLSITTLLAIATTGHCEPPRHHSDSDGVQSPAVPPVPETAPQPDTKPQWLDVPSVVGDECVECSGACGVTSPAAPNPFRANLFDNNFSSPRNACAPRIFGEELKNLPLHGDDCCDPWTFSFGGELRHRHMNEIDRLRPGGPGKSTYDLWRWRNYVEVSNNSWFRVYVEMLDASIFNEDLPVTPIDMNRWNLQNYFVDLKLTELEGNAIQFRVGRQELLYGSQQLISPLDWANTRRNFEGFKLFSRGNTWDIDVFATRPVNTATGRPVEQFNNERDEPDWTRWFSGVYAVYHGIENQTFDFYWLRLDTDNRFHVPTLADGDRRTIGMRWHGIHKVHDECCRVAQVWDADIEGAYQYGEDNGEDVRAGFFTSKLGVTLPQVPWSPTIKGVYYWGSGDQDPNDGENNTFSVLFPLGHAYWGIIDNLAGQNLHDYSLQAIVRPTKKLTCTAAIHWFDLDSNADRLYNVAGAAVGTAGSGLEVGEELDLIANYNFNPNFSVQAGYSWFWYGTYVETSSLRRNDANQLYVQTTLRY